MINKDSLKNKISNLLVLGTVENRQAIINEIEKEIDSLYATVKRLERQLKIKDLKP